MKNSNDFNKVYPYILIGALVIFLSFCVNMTGESLRRTDYFFLAVTLILVTFVFRKVLPKSAVIWVIIGGVFVKTAYILYTAVWTRQHDVISFGAGEGHAAYIEYILYNRSLPNFDPRLVWSFFQPPLHHTICAVWMWINIRLGVAERQLEENVQCLTLCYMCVLMVVTYCICRELSMKQRGTLITMLIVSFHPIYTLLSGSINNDALSVCLSGIAVYIAIKWYKKPTVISILLLGACIGFAMMAKLSSGLVAPGIGAMMLYKLVKCKKEIFKYIVQYVLFGVVVFPLGLWWPIRNKILWDMPVNYIPEVGEQLTHSGIISRLFDVRMSTVYPAMINNGNAYDEYNVFLAMIKTSLFGESNFGQVSSKINIFAAILFVTSIIIIVFEIVAFVRTIVVKDVVLQTENKILLGVTALSLFGGYMMFALGYNNFSAQDFRYSALLIVIMALFLGMWDDRLESVSVGRKNDEKLVKNISIVRTVILAVAAVFAVSSTVVYLLVGILA